MNQNQNKINRKDTLTEIHDMVPADSTVIDNDVCNHNQKQKS